MNEREDEAESRVGTAGTDASEATGHIPVPRLPNDTLRSETKQPINAPATDESKGLAEANKYKTR
jgi:hypothetical protein